MVIKQCIICGEEFNANGGANVCSDECRKERDKQYRRQYYQANKEEIKNKRKKYYQNNKEKVLKSIKKYHKDNREKILKQRKQYRQDNKEHIEQYREQYYQKNREKVLESNKKSSKKYYQNNRDVILLKQAAYKKERVSELIKQYDGDLDKILEKVPTRWHLREAQMQVWFNESYYDGIIAKIEFTPCCEVTGEKDNLVIHHLYSFDTHPELGNDPTNMVRIHEKVHKEFHKRYGYGNNTVEQWEVFIKKYNGKITTLDDFK